MIINDTSNFYTGDAPSLFWEMTICQSLSDLSSGYMKALDEPALYGDILARFLQSKVGGVQSVVEVGGGYGTLMKGLIPTLSPRSVTMVDISPVFVEVQKKTLAGLEGIEFVNADVFEYLKGSPPRVDLWLSNENIGDFLTLDDVDAHVIHSLAQREGPFDHSHEGRCAGLVAKYGLEIPREGRFAFNLGALEYAELVTGCADAVFLSEHSADVKAAPPYDFLTPLADGNPRRIPLKDHLEYSIKFDFVEKIALANGFDVLRLTMPEFLGVRTDQGARFMAQTECVGNENAEVLHEFLNHVKEYECLLMTRRK